MTPKKNDVLAHLRLEESQNFKQTPSNADRSKKIAKNQNKNHFQKLKSKTLEKLKDLKSISKNEIFFMSPMRFSKKNNRSETSEENRI